MMYFLRKYDILRSAEYDRLEDENGVLLSPTNCERRVRAEGSAARGVPRHELAEWWGFRASGLQRFWRSRDNGTTDKISKMKE